MEKPSGRAKITAARSIRLNLKCSTGFRECFYQLQGHCYVRRLFGIFSGNVHRPGAWPSTEQHPRCELRTLRNADAAFASSRPRPVNPGRQAIIRGFYSIPKLAQRAEERRLRPFVHSRHSVQVIHPMTETNQRRQKTCRRSRVANKYFQRLFLGAGVRNFATQTLDQDSPITKFHRVGLDLNFKAEFPQRFNHYLGVFTPEGPFQLCLPIRQGCQEKGAIG